MPSTSSAPSPTPCARLASMPCWPWSAWLLERRARAGARPALDVDLTLVGQLVAFEKLARNYQALNLAGALADQHERCVAVVAFDVKLFGVAKAAKDAHGLQGDVLAHLGGKELGHAGLQVAALAAILLARCLLDQQARRLDVGGHVGQLELDGLVLGDGLPEGAPLLRVLDGILEGCAGHTYRAGSHVDATDLQTTHGVFEALALALA